MWQLIVKNSKGQVLREPVSLAAGTLNIGRGLECDIVLDSKLVSRLHASLHVDGSQLLLRDEGSANGSAVDGQPVGKTPTRIDAGARIEIADFVIELRRAAAATPTPPSAPDALEMTVKPVAAAPARPTVPPVQEVAFAEVQLMDTLLLMLWSTRTFESWPFAFISAVGTMTVMGTCVDVFAEPEGQVTV